MSCRGDQLIQFQPIYFPTGLSLLFEWYTGGFCKDNRSHKPGGVDMWIRWRRCLVETPVEFEHWNWWYYQVTRFLTKYWRITRLSLFNIVFTLAWTPTPCKNWSKFISLYQDRLLVTLTGTEDATFSGATRSAAYVNALVKNVSTLSVRLATLRSIIETSAGPRSVNRPEGSPTRPVAPPT